jgi:NAD+ kinase
MSFNNVGIIVKPESHDVSEILDSVVAYLKTRSCKVFVDKSAKSYAELIAANKLEMLDRKTLGDQCELVITLGGDGTILNAARSLADKNVPLLGINMGRLGFLADISPDEFIQVLDEIFAGNYEQDERYLFAAEVVRNDETIFNADALNDAVLHVRNVARMIEFETRIDGQFVNHQGADGLIVTTPTGSTAYAVSSGGPILHANLEAMALVPICPHTLSSRPLVVGSDSLVEVLICNTKQAIAQVTCDGQTSFDMEEGDVLRIRKKTHTVTLLHPNNHNYYEILRAKLRWSEHLQA